MAVQWSGWHDVAGNGMRVGVDVSVSAVTQSSSTVTFTYDVWTENRWAYNDLQWLTFGGNSSGTFNYNNTDGGGVQRRRTTRQYTYTYPPGSFNTSPGNTSFTVAVGGAYNGSAPGITVTTAIPARPGSPVAPPTNVTLTRQSDQQWTINWTPGGTPSAPYTSQTVYIQAYTQENGVWAWRPGPNHFSPVGTVGPGVSTYSQSNAGPNIGYRAAVQGNGQFSSSTVVVSNYLWMTPAAPTSLQVERSPTGNEVTLIWDPNHYAGAGVTYQIEYRVDGGAWTVEATGLMEQLVSYTAVLPSTGTVEYRIRAYQPVGPIASDWAYFAPVANAFPPLSPVNLAPNGETRDATAPIVFTWRHRPSADGSRESQFQLRWSTDGGSTWVTDVQRPSAPGGGYYQMPGGTLTNGATYQWQARTWGVTSAGPGPWSDSATLPASATPVVTISTPGATQASVPLTASWVFSQAQGLPQARWEARLYAALGSNPTVPNAVVEVRSGTGTDTSTTFDYRIEDGAYYRVEVRAQSQAGLWSQWVSQDTLVDLPMPAEPTVAGEYDLCSGTVVLQLASLPPGAGEVPITHMVLERRIGSGEWVILADSLPVPTTFVDTLPSTVGANEYRVTAWSGAPSWRTTTLVVNGLDGPNPYGGSDGLWVFLSYGAGFENVLRFRGEPDLSSSTGRTRRAQHFAGRPEPVLLMGDNTTYEVDVSGALFYEDPCDGADPCRYDSAPREWEEAGRRAGMVAYRDFHGRRFFAMLGAVKVDHAVPVGHARVSFTLTQVDSRGLRIAGGGEVWPS